MTLALGRCIRALTEMEYLCPSKILSEVTLIPEIDSIGRRKKLWRNKISQKESEKPWDLAASS
jgi:hypothetical protein